MKAQVAWSEIEFLIICWVVGNVHLAVLASYASITVHHHCGVVVETGSTPFKERGDDDKSQFFGQLTEKGSRRSRNWLCQIKIIHVLHLAEIQRVVQLLQHHQFCTGSLQGPDASFKTFHVVCPVGSITLLYDSYLHNINDIIV